MTRKWPFVLLLLVSITRGAAAADRPVVFIHGLASGPETWEAASARLASQLAMQPMHPRLSWPSFYESQAAELDAAVGASVGSDVVTVGHSNGGVVARQWARGRPVGSVITVGSPNQGAPIVDHLFEWFSFLDDILFRIVNVNNVFALDVDSSVWWWLPAQWITYFNQGIDVWSTAGNGLLSLGLDAREPVLSEMRVGSAYMAGLNASTSLDREAAQVPGRVAILSVPREFDHGGPFRIVDPAHYEDWHIGILTIGVSLDGLAGVIRVLADFDDWGAFELADHVATVAEWFLDFEEVWCRSVSDPSPLSLGACREHDGIVPAWSQVYDIPRLPFIVNPNGPVHTSETAESDAQLFQALTTIAHVPLRSDAPPGDGGNGNGGGDGGGPDKPQHGRYKWSDGVCVWDPDDDGPNQCEPAQASGRFRLQIDGVCAWDPNDSGPDQCQP